jgi:hypothetical protein
MYRRWLGIRIICLSGATYLHAECYFIQRGWASTVILVHSKHHHFIKILEEFEDIKGELRVRISKRNRQHNGQKKKYKRTKNYQQNKHIQLKIEYHLWYLFVKCFSIWLSVFYMKIAVNGLQLTSNSKPLSYADCVRCTYQA